MDNDVLYNKDVQNDFSKYSLITFFTIFIIFIANLFIYLKSVPDELINNTKSINRVNSLNNVLTSLLGNNWRYILIFLIIFLMIIVYLLYTYSLKGIIINMDPHQYKILSWFMIGFIILYTIYIIVLIVKLYMNNKDSNNLNKIPNFIPSQNQDSQNKTILQIFALGSFILISIVVGVIYFLKNRNK
jgi:hypothetical protein